jgi:hypothetical protein
MSRIEGNNTMNRALAIRYGERMPIISKAETGKKNSFASHNYLSLHDGHDVKMHPFGSHQILVSCLKNYDLEIKKFLFREIPVQVIETILKFLDLKSTKVARTFIKETEKLSSKRGGDSSGFGSKARLAMTLLSNKLRPMISKQTITSIDLESNGYQGKVEEDGCMRDVERAILSPSQSYRDLFLTSIAADANDDDTPIVPSNSQSQPQYDYSYIIYYFLFLVTFLFVICYPSPSFIFLVLILLGIFYLLRSTI